MSLLAINDLRVVYANGHEALKRVSLQAEAGEIIAIIGRSGAGKSTMLRCIAGLQRPIAGSIQLDGVEMTTLSDRDLRLARRKIGFIWQEYNLVDRLPAITNVLTGRLGYNQPYKSLFGFFGREHRTIALRNLERVNLLEKAYNRADRLSGGEKQRVSIARAISQEPKVLLADEPVASLDPELAWQVMGDLSRITREDNVLTLINIHQVELARAFADRVIGIARGEVVYDGSPVGLNESILDQVYRFDRIPTATRAVGSDLVNI
jgi:phosphonate transport system ATP-binding protein